MTNIEKIRANLIALTRPCDATAELASEALRLFDEEVGREAVAWLCCEPSGLKSAVTTERERAVYINCGRSVFPLYISPLHPIHNTQGAEVMSKTKFTPGPWEEKRLIDNDGNPYATSYLAHIDIGPCMIWCPVGNIEQQANAHLIAAAPELYEALDKMLDQLNEQISGVVNDELAAISKARRAMEKARGES